MLLLYLSMLEAAEDKSKFEQIYDKYGRLMQYVANKILQDDYLAEDAVHTAFIKIIANIEKIGDITCHKTKAFVVIVVENEAKRIYKHRKKHPTVSFNEIEYEISDSRDGFEELMSDLTVKEIACEIEALSEFDSEILMLRYIHDFTDKEVARLLNIKESAARKRLERARQRLAARLEKVGG